jgi:uncharacterized metal-binding protein
MLMHGIGLIQHVGLRKKEMGGYDKIINPITDAFNNYEIGKDLNEFLVNPLIDRLKNIRNESKCANTLESFIISLKSFSKSKH